MLLRHSPDIKPSDITPQSLYLDRRRFLALGAAGALGLAAGMAPGRAPAGALPGLVPAVVPGPFATDEPRTPLADITSYNNFTELGPDKEDPKAHAAALVTRPWTVEIGGACAKPGTLAYDDLIKPHRLEERIYRHRCVEAWSMVIPWVGFPLAELLARFEPTSRAKFVEFTTLHDPAHLPGQRLPLLDWPYVEGLRLDEAMHPLALLAVGLYGQELLPQNGAPLRLVVPWKYGFKSIKSIVRIRFVETAPLNTWQKSQPNEYGFYSNVNPQVDHPRWSQAKERRIGDLFRRPTLMFNGYGDQVAALYAGMDLKANF